MILLLILLSLSTTFDNWDTTASVATILAFCFLLTAYAMVVLRRVARRGKEHILEQIEDQVATQRSAAAASDKERLSLLVERIRHLQRGAFRHWYQEPVIKSLLWVLGVASLLITQHIRIGV
jgi:DNA-binding GntR family transcriptional regulator